MRDSGRFAAVRRVLLTVALANLAVIAAKVVIGLRSGSIAVLGDALHSSVDLLNNVVGLLAIRAAAVPPDEDHPYGHGKFEFLGAMAIVSFLSVTCYEIVTRAVDRLLSAAAPPRVDGITLGVLLATACVNALVAWAEDRHGRRLHSAILRADARHTAADLAVTLSVIGGLLLTRLGWASADAWLALGVAALIARAAYRILAQAVPILVDERAVEAERIRRFVLSVSGVRGVAEIRSRGRLDGGEAFAELTIEVDGGCSVEEGHGIADAVEKKLEQKAGFARAVVHVEPHADVAGREEEPQSG